MRRLIGAVATVVVVAGTIVLGAVPVSAACHIVNFSEPSYTVQENAGTVTITIERQIFGNGCPGTINYTTEDDTAKDPADYKKTSGTFAYASTESSKSFTVPIVNNSDRDLDRTFKVKFDGSSPGPVSGSANVTIQDDDAGAAQSPSPEVTTQEEDEALGEEEDEGTPVGLIVAIVAGVLVVGAGAFLLARRGRA